MAHVKCFKTLNSCRLNLGVTHGEFDLVGNNQNKTLIAIKNGKWKKKKNKKKKKNLEL
jgi:hypothetical protein